VEEGEKLTEELAGLLQEVFNALVERERELDGGPGFEKCKLSCSDFRDFPADSLGALLLLLFARSLELA